MNRVGLSRENVTPTKQFISIFHGAKTWGIVLAVLNFGLIFMVLLYSILPKQYSLKVGDILQNPISATRDIEDTIATQRLKEAARDNVSQIYRFDQHITESVIIEIEDTFDQIDKARQLVLNRFEDYKQELKNQQESLETTEDVPIPGEEDTESNTSIEPLEPDPDEILTDQFIGEIKKDFPIMLSKDEIMTCLNADVEELNQLRDQLLGTLRGLMELHIKQDNLLEAKNALREDMMSLPVSNELRILGTTIGVSSLKPNMLLDETATQEERERVASNVDPVIYKKDQYIVQAGQPVTEEQYLMLQTLGLLKEDKVNIPIVLGTGIFLLLVEVIVIIYLITFEKRTLKNPKHLMLISLITWAVLGLGIVTGGLHQYLIPAALGSMSLTILIGSSVAGIMNIALAVLFGIMSDNGLNVAVMTILGGITGIYMCSRAEQRNSLVWAGVGVSFTNLLCIFGIEIASSGNWYSALNMSAWGIGSGLLSGIFLLGTLPVWENLFGIVTPIKLVELANPNHPALKRLLMEAPGTYHHSIIVANLAENAADAIGADGLLTRVGAYYHDIGKLKRPFYFKENQIASGNPHDKLSPTLSTRIITSHTKDGIELAKKYKVPKVIQDFILQHHGTTTAAYFYHKALESDKDGRVNQEDFRYSGPKPKTRETAIVMMADTVEAAIRALPDPTQGKVEGLIRKLIKGKLDDGQLDDCHLTLKDLNTVAIAFSGAMAGIFHERIEYPNLHETQDITDEEVGYEKI